MRHTLLPALLLATTLAACQGGPPDEFMETCIGSHPDATEETCRCAHDYARENLSDDNFEIFTTMYLPDSGKRLAEMWEREGFEGNYDEMRAGLAGMERACSP